MKIEEAKPILAARAIERHPGKMLTYCGSKKCWNDCFTIINNKLVFWYNIGEGTFNEVLTLDKGIATNLKKIPFPDCINKNCSICESICPFKFNKENQNEKESQI